MGWKDLLQTGNETLVSPWTGGSELRSGARTWTIKGKRPPEHGWYTFHLKNREATFGKLADGSSELLRSVKCGYLVGDRFVADDVRVDPNPAKIVDSSESVLLVEPGLDRFARLSAGRTHEDGPLVYAQQEMPLGPEEDVLRTFLDQKESVDSIPGVVPALDAAFRMEVYQRVEARRRREELERQRREEEERLAREQRRQQLFEQLGNAQGRREMAKEDFGEAARAALAVGGAEYLDHRQAIKRNEMVVRYRMLRRRFECVCDAQTLRIIDAGICLIDHNTDERGDTYFTLESLPGVIQQAHNEGRLVVFRHVDE
jgi:hypothetical protein